MTIVNEAIEGYLKELRTEPDDVRREIEALAEELDFPIVGPDAGRLLSILARRVLASWGRTSERLARCVADPRGTGPLHVRRNVEALVQAAQVALLLRHAAWEAKRGERTETAAAAEFYFAWRLDHSVRPEDDPGYAGRLRAVLADDLPG